MREIVQDKGTKAIIEHENVLLALATGVGKTKAYVDALNEMSYEKIYVVLFINDAEKDLLLDYQKWNLNKKVNFINYKSIHKIPSDTEVLILEEAHHITPESLKELRNINAKKRIYVSATVNWEKRRLLTDLSNNNLKRVAYPLKTAIEDGVLPTPNIVLYPVLLDTTTRTSVYKAIKHKVYPWKNISYPEYVNTYKYRKDKNNYNVLCTEREHYDLIEEKIDYFNSRLVEEKIVLNNIESEINTLKNKKFTLMKDVEENRANIFDLEKEYKSLTKGYEYTQKKRIYLGSDRKKFLSKVKEKYVIKLKDELVNQYEKLLIFCNSKDTAEKLGNFIHSSNPDNDKVYNDFIEGKINYISTIKMFDETKNVPGIEAGIIQELDKEPRTTIQRMGRVLRSENPDVYIITVLNTNDDLKIETFKKLL